MSDPKQPTGAPRASDGPDSSTHQDAAADGSRGNIDGLGPRSPGGYPEAAWQCANDELPHTWTPCQDNGEVGCVLDAIADGDDPTDALAEWRHWRSPAGRRQEAQELFDSGHPLSDGARSVRRARKGEAR